MRVVGCVGDSAPVLAGCVETTVRTYSVTDACGNSISVTQNLIRTVDTQNPTASNPAALVLTGCNGTFPSPNAAVVTDEADNCEMRCAWWVVWATARRCWPGAWKRRCGPTA